MVLPAAALPTPSGLGSLRVPGLREYIMLFVGHCCKEVRSPELIEQLLALQEKSHSVPFPALAAGLRENKNP